MMTHTEFKAARKALGFSIFQMAQVLRVAHRHIRRMETEPDDQSHRQVSPMTEAFVRILLGEYGRTLPEILARLREDQDGEAQSAPSK